MSYAIFREDLIDNEGVNGDDSEPTINLTNDIHPIFHRSRFSNLESDDVQGMVGRRVRYEDINWDESPLDEDLYERLRPTLQLASLFLEHTFEGFWCKVLVAPYLVWPARRTYASETWMVEYDRNFRPDKRALATARDRLDNVYPPLVHFFFTERPLVGATAFTTSFKAPAPRHVVIDVETSRLDFLKDEGYFPTAWDNVRHTFMLAKTLVHELAHAVHQVRARSVLRCRSTRNRHGYYDSRFCPDDPENDPELGNAWEKYMFGGVMKPVNGEYWRRDGDCWSKWRQGPYDNQDWEPIIDVRSLVPLLQDALWRHGAKPRRPGRLLPSEAIIGHFRRAGGKRPFRCGEAGCARRYFKTHVSVVEHYDTVHQGIYQQVETEVRHTLLPFDLALCPPLADANITTDSEDFRQDFEERLEQEYQEIVSSEQQRIARGETIEEWYRGELDTQSDAESIRDVEDDDVSWTTVSDRDPVGYPNSPTPLPYDILMSRKIKSYKEDEEMEEEGMDEEESEEEDTTEDETDEEETRSLCRVT